MNVPIPHDKDFAAWAMAQAEALRSGNLQELDRAHIAEELEEMGRNEQRELRSRLTLLMAHLIKHVAQPERRGRSWTNTIDRSRLDIADLLGESPSLRRFLADEPFLLGAWKRGAIDASSEMNTEWRDLPPTCPWPIPSILDEAFLPESFGSDNELEPPSI